MTNNDQPRRILPHHIPASPDLASRIPAWSTPEKVAASIETLRLGIEQFKAELAAGPQGLSKESGLVRTEATDQAWISGQTRLISEWEAALAGYLELQAKQA